MKTRTANAVSGTSTYNACLKLFIICTTTSSSSTFYARCSYIQSIICPRIFLLSLAMLIVIVIVDVVVTNHDDNNYDDDCHCFLFYRLLPGNTGGRDTTHTRFG